MPRITSLLFLATLLLFASRAVFAADDPEEYKKQFIEFSTSKYEEAESFVYPPKEYIETVFSGETAPINLSNAQIDELSWTIRSSFFFQRAGEDYQLEADLFNIPNIAFADIRLLATALVDEKGEKIQLGKSRPNPIGLPEFNSAALKRIKSPIENDTNEYNRILGVAIVKIPVKFAFFEIKDGDEGAEIDSAAGAIKVEAFRENYLRFKFKPTDSNAARNIGSMRIIAKDFYGRALKTYYKQAILSEDFKLLKAGETKKLANIDYKRHIEKNKPDAFGEQTVVFLPYGSMKSALVAIALAYETFEVEFVATKEPQVGSETKIIKYPRYSPPPLFEFEFCEFSSEEELLDTIRYGEARCQTQLKYNELSIEVLTPYCANSLFAEIDFSEPYVVDELGRRLAATVEKQDFDSVDCRSSAHILTEDFYEDVSEPFYKAAGKIYVKYPARFKKLELIGSKTDFENYGFKIDGCFVSYDTEKLMILSRTSVFVSTFSAYDSTGKRLRELDYGKFGEGAVFLRAYWGEVAKVEAWVVDEWLEIEIEYDLPPAEALPQREEEIFEEE